MGYVVCGACIARIPPSNWNQGGAVPCPLCAQPVEVRVFPAALKPVTGTAPEPVVTGEESSCYNHARNRAVSACDRCGRFLCGLCDIEGAGIHVCPACFEKGAGREVDPARTQERINYDSIALALVTLPTFFCWLPLLTTPAALFFAFRHWKDPSPVMPRSRWRLWLTVLVALLQVGFLIFIFGVVIPSQKKGGAIP